MGRCLGRQYLLYSFTTCLTVSFQVLKCLYLAEARNTVLFSVLPRQAIFRLFIFLILNYLWSLIYMGASSSKYKKYSFSLRSSSISRTIGVFLYKWPHNCCLFFCFPERACTLLGVRRTAMYFGLYPKFGGLGFWFFFGADCLLKFFMKEVQNLTKHLQHHNCCGVGIWLK